MNMGTVMNKLQDLPDMTGAGMGLTEALAFWNEMMNPFVSRVCCMELPIAICNH
jgi:hypothetical protein